MIEGIGTDIIEIDRIRESIEKHGSHFLDRLFSKKEQDYCYKYKDPSPHFAGRFAAKEAIADFGPEVLWIVDSLSEYYQVLDSMFSIVYEAIYDKEVGANVKNQKDFHRNNIVNLDARAIKK